MAADGRCGYDSCQDSRDACCEIDNLRAHEHGVTKKGSSGELSSSEVQVCFSSGLGVFMRALLHFVECCGAYAWLKIGICCAASCLVDYSAADYLTSLR